MRNFCIHDKGKGREVYEEDNAETAQKNQCFAEYQKKSMTSRVQKRSEC